MIEHIKDTIRTIDHIETFAGRLNEEQAFLLRNYVRVLRKHLSLFMEDIANDALKNTELIERTIKMIEGNYEEN
jgi:hypothetical protein